MANNPFNISVDKNNYPAVGFSFHITTTPSEPISTHPIPTGVIGNYSEGSFQKVSGIKASLKTEDVGVLGMNNQQLKLPNGVSYDNLVLSRGLVKKDSFLGIWCDQMLTSQSNLYTIERKTINLFLYDYDSNTVLTTWTFFNCFPLEISVDGFDAMNKTSIVVDNMTLTYSHYTKITIPWQ